MKTNKKSFKKNVMFRASIKDSPKANPKDFDFSISCEDETKLTFDEVDDVVFKHMNEEYPEEYYPKASCEDIFIIENGKAFPVVSESNKDKIEKLEKSKKYEKFLILPDALYSLTPECLLYMKMKEEGIIDEDADFNFEKMHKLVESLKR